MSVSQYRVDLQQGKAFAKVGAPWGNFEAVLPRECRDEWNEIDRKRLEELLLPMRSGPTLRVWFQQRSRKRLTSVSCHDYKTKLLPISKCDLAVLDFRFGGDVWRSQCARSLSTAFLTLGLECCSDTNDQQIFPQ